MAEVFFSIGSNQGDRLDNLESAIKQLTESVGTIKKVSAIYESEPWGYKGQNQFLNQVLWFETDLSPSKVLEIAMDIEHSLGRKRTKGWHGYESRTMDIDILLFDKMELDTEKLTIPHPKMHLRNFVLIPLVEIAPEVEHPYFRISAAELKENCNDKSKVTPYQ